MLIGQYLFAVERGRETTTQRGREKSDLVLRERGVSALKAENSMMTMTTMADGLEAQDSSKSAFMEFGQQSHSQQSSPSMASGHYPLHCLHSGSHAHHQHDNTPYPGTNTYNRSLPYPYVSHPHHSPYLPSYHNNTGGQTRLDGTGKRPPSPPPFFHQPSEGGKSTGFASIPRRLLTAPLSAYLLVFFLSIRVGNPRAAGLKPFLPAPVVVSCPSHCTASPRIRTNDLFTRRWANASKEKIVRKWHRG